MVQNNGYVWSVKRGAEHICGRKICVQNASQAHLKLSCSDHYKSEKNAFTKLTLERGCRHYTHL